MYREHRLVTAIVIPGLLFLVWVALEGYAMARSESEHTDQLYVQTAVIY